MDSIEENNDTVDSILLEIIDYTKEGIARLQYDISMSQERLRNLEYDIKCLTKPSSSNRKVHEIMNEYYYDQRIRKYKQLDKNIKEKLNVAHEKIYGEKLFKKTK